MTVLLLAAAAGLGVPIALKINDGASFDERLEYASRLLQEVPLIDGHNDLPWNIRKFMHNRIRDFKFGEGLKNVTPWSSSAWSHTDLPRLKQGHVAAQVSRTIHISYQEITKSRSNESLRAAPFPEFDKGMTARGGNAQDFLSGV